jgi:streptogramin lyase
METDEEIRSRLRRTPDDVPPFAPRIDQVLRRARVRRLRRLAAAGVVAAILVAGVGVPLGVLLGLGGSSRPSPAGEPSLVHPVLEVQIHVPSGAVDVAVGNGAVWVSGFGAVTRLDPRTDEVVATIETPGTEDFSRVAVGEGAVWVTADGGKVYRIDPVTNTVVATIPVGGPIIGVWAGDGAVWVTRPSDGGGELVRIDPATNAMVGEPIEVGPGPVSVVSAFGALWVTNTSPPSVVRVDPTSGEVRIVGFTGQVAAGDGSLWAASEDRVVRADPETGQPIETFRIPRAAAIEVAEGLVWVLAYPESSSPDLFYPIKGTAALWEIDPTDNRIVGQPVQIDDLQPIALAAGEGAVWVADYDGATVTRFALVPCSDPACTPTASPDVSTTQTTPSPDGANSVDFGPGRLPYSVAFCPSGPFEPVGNADRAIRDITEALLQAANGTSPDPAKVWAIMDDSFRELFASYEYYATRFEQVSVDPEWTVWDIHTVHPRPDAPFDALGWIRENCGEEVAAALTTAMWELDVFWPNAEGLAAGVTHVYYVGRADGPRLWLVY